MLTLRKADATDSAQLAALHRQNFARPWSEAEFLSFFSRSGIVAFIAESPEACGFIFSWVVAGECELLSLAISPPNRRQGIARALCERTLEQAAKDRAKNVFLEVAVSNKAAIGLYQSLGFTISHRRKHYYLSADGSREDALTMVKHIS